MPELPEVETIKNELLPHVLGSTITGVTLLWEKMVKNPSARQFIAQVNGKKITGMNRRGKYLFFHLSDGPVLVVHLKLTGSLVVDPSDDRFTRAIIHLDNGKKIHFWDPRKFGKMWLADDESAVANALGPEPLDAGFTLKLLAERLHDRKAPVKPVLLDQSIIAGIGNMYADEALFEAKIHPERPAGSLSKEEVARLYRAIRRVLKAAIKNKGASVRNYYRPDGTTGTAHYEFRVAHGTGKTCPNCGAPIERIVVRGRGTYYCPRCQRKEAISN